MVVRSESLLCDLQCRNRHRRPSAGDQSRPQALGQSSHSSTTTNAPVAPPTLLMQGLGEPVGATEHHQPCPDDCQCPGRQFVPMLQSLLLSTATASGLHRNLSLCDFDQLLLPRTNRRKGIGLGHRIGTMGNEACITHRKRCLSLCIMKYASPLREYPQLALLILACRRGENA